MAKALGKPASNNPGRSATLRTKDGEERYIIIAKSDLIQAMKDLAYWERLNIKEAYEEAIKDRIAKYEKKNGPLKPAPKK